MERIVEKMNLLWAAAVTLLSAAFGTYWYLFAAFMILNVVDYGTGIIKARYTGTENSNKGLKGILKKLGYWIVICIAFFIATAFGSLGEQIGIDLGFASFIGWFVLGTFIINEIRSVLENLIMIGVEVPAWLVKGLEIANDRINNAAGGGTDDSSTGN
ncbi:MAG: phage holin family protein [Candidatus Ornithomonoglobus sp.]